MANNDNIKAVKVGGLNIQSATIGQDIQTRFDTIDQNFQQILMSEYLKGVKGDSVYSETLVLKSREASDYFEQIKQLIFGDKLSDITEKRLSKLGEQPITLIFEKAEVGEPILLSVLPFIYKDPLFDENMSNINVDESDVYNGLDYSCTICYDKQEGFQKLDVPSVYYDSDKKRFNWKINGVDTGLVAQGPPGSQGETGTGLLIAEYDEVAKKEIIDDVTYIYKYIKLTSFYYNMDDDTNTSNKPSDLNDAKWVPVTNSEKINKIPLINNCLVFARKKLGAQETQEVDENLAPVVDEGDGSQTAVGTPAKYNWRWGLLFIDKADGTTIYKLKDGGSLNEIIGLNGESLMNLMKENRYTFIPNKKDNVLDIVPNADGHIIYSDDNGNLQLESTISDPELKSQITLESQYSNNVFKKIQIPVEGTDKKPLTLGKQVQGKDTYYVDFSDCGTVKGNIESADKLNTDAGSNTEPVFFSKGVPVKCGTKLSSDISGKADTAGTADVARQLIIVDDKGESKPNVGSANKPIYFADGKPVECTSVELKSDTAGIADVAKKLTVNAGSNTKPVYFVDGKPVECRSVSLKAATAGTADKANQLTVNAGSSKQPVYFENGKPMVCKSIELKADTAGVADFALQLQSKQRSAVNVGSSTKPVYFSNGVPVECGTIGVAAKANKLSNSRSFAISGGVISAAVSFNGEANVTLPVTSINESYLNWGERNSADVRITPIDVAMNTELSANRLSFMPANDISVDYSTDGGTTWTDYGASDASKQSHVTTGLGCDFYLGKKTTGQLKSDKLRITITATAGATYFSLKKILVQVSTNGAQTAFVNVEVQKNGSGVWTQKGQYPVSGWFGWNSIPLVAAFGGADTQTNNIRKIRLTYSISGPMGGYETRTAFKAMALAMHGENSWSSVNALAAFGHLYGWDAEQNAFFPAGLSVTKQLDAASIVSKDNQLRNINALNILPMSGYSKIGDSGKAWAEIHADKVITNDFNVSSITATNADFKTAEIDEVKTDKIKHVIIQDKLPVASTTKLEAKELNYTVSNNLNAVKYFGVDPVDGKSSGTIHIANIVLKTSELPMVMNDKIDVKINNMCFPIGITYINDYDDVKKYSNWWWRTFRYWAYVGIRNVKVQIFNGSTMLAEKSLSGYQTTLYEEYSSNKRNGAVYYPSTSFTFDDIALTKSGSKYKDVTLSVKLSYIVERTVGSDYRDATRTRVDYVYTPGAYIMKSNPTVWQAKHVYTGYPSINQQNKASNNDVINGIYTPLIPTNNYIYLTNEGIQIVNGRSTLTIVPPKDGNGKGTGDDFGYIEVKQLDTTKNTVSYITKKKSLWDLLS